LPLFLLPLFLLPLFLLPLFLLPLFLLLLFPFLFLLGLRHGQDAHATFGHARVGVKIMGRMPMLHSDTPVWA
jgi:hypothetical protein